MIVPGVSNNNFCENCLRDASLLRTFRQMGHEIITVPMYLPFPTDNGSDKRSPIFFGGINVYLQQKFAIFRKLPLWLDRWLDNPGLLNWVSRRFNMVDASLLGSTTLSMLKGPDGLQTKELRRLLRWLEDVKTIPDVVYLSNVLLAGLAGPVRQKLHVPIVCMLSGEDSFLDSLLPQYNTQAWQTMSDRALQIDMFVAANQPFAEKMRQQLNIIDGKLKILSASPVEDSMKKTADEIISIFSSALQNFKEAKNA